MKDRRRLGFSPVVICVFLLFCRVRSYSAEQTTTLRLVQLVHRHGARYPIVPHNETEICGGKPCGSLTPEGLTMLINAGKFLRAHYNGDDSAPFFQSASYNISVSYTESTSFSRTIQSAVGLLTGLFPDPNTFFPVVYTRYDDADSLLRSYTNPYSYAFLNLDADWWQTVCNPEADKIISYDTLVSISKEVFSEGACSDPKDQCRCAHKLFDIGASMAVDGRITKHPQLEQHMERLRRVEKIYFKELFGYKPSDTVHVKMGSLGQSLAQKILSNVEDYVNGTTKFRLFHYSAHDTTLAPLASTLGDATPTGILPPFGQLYAFELLYDEVGRDYVVRVRRGAPGQTPQSKYLFEWDGFQLKCMDERNNTYSAKNNTCPYRDLKRFVDSTKPKEPAGLCYLSDKYKMLFNCPGEAKEPLGEDCKALRRMCPEWACESDYTLNSVTLECVRTLHGGAGGRFPLKWRLLLGFIVVACICAFVVLMCCSRGRKKDTEESVVEGVAVSQQKGSPSEHLDRVSADREGVDIRDSQLGDPCSTGAQ